MDCALRGGQPNIKEIKKPFASGNVLQLSLNAIFLHKKGEKKEHIFIKIYIHFFLNTFLSLS